MISKVLEIPFWLIQKNPHVNYDAFKVTRGELLERFVNANEKVSEGNAADLFDVISAEYPNGQRYIWQAEFYAADVDGVSVRVETTRRDF
jgi:hypothetical protein